MKDQVTLMEYLQPGLPSIPTIPPAKPGRNTTSHAYSYNDITNIGVWADFSLPTILRRYENILTEATLPWDPFPDSPQQPINTRNTLSQRIYGLVLPRIRRGLRAAYNQMHASGQSNGYTHLSITLREIAQNPGGFIPGLAYYVPSLDAGTGPNRAPGSMKPSWMWDTSLATGSERDQKEYRQVLSQVNWYMKQHNCRYGFVISDLEMIAIRRLDNDGSLELSTPIPWEVGGGPQPRLTILLALWYLGMLAAQDEGPDQWMFE